MRSHLADESSHTLVLTATAFQQRQLGSTQLCPPGSLNGVPVLTEWGNGGNITSVGRQVTLVILYGM